MKDSKYIYSILFGIIICIIMAPFIAHALVFTTQSTGMRVGDNTLNVLQAGQNLFYGFIPTLDANNNASQGSLMLFQRHTAPSTYTNAFRIDLSGNITISGAGTTANATRFCLQNVCISQWSEAGGASNAIQNQFTRDQEADFKISGQGTLSNIEVRPQAGEGIRIVSNASMSPFAIQDSAGSSDIFRVSESGDITGSYTLKGYDIGTQSGRIAINAGKGNTNIDLDANYLEGRDWTDITNYIESSAPSQVAEVPEKKYFITQNTTKGDVGGYTGLDAFCNSDPNKPAGGGTYHVWAGNEYNRGFLNDVHYTDAAYGDFMVENALLTQAPDICKTRGLVCDTAWQSTFNNYIWNTKQGSCNNWTEITNATVGLVQNPFDTTNAIPAIGASYSGDICWDNWPILCIEDHLPVSDPLPESPLGEFFRLDIYRNYADAEIECNNNDGTLAIINNSIENSNVLNLMYSWQNSNHWIGLNDQETEGTSEWKGAYPYFGYTRWISGEPNGSSGENCTEMYHLNEPWSGYWNDKSCSTYNKIMCRRTINLEFSQGLITDSNRNQTITITYGRPMDTSIEPTVVINNLASSYTITGGSWSVQNTKYTVSFTVNDDNEFKVADVQVSGGKYTDGTNVVTTINDIFTVLTRPNTYNNKIQFFDEKVGWSTATSRCSALSGNWSLAWINDATEFNELRQAYPTESMWIGLNDRAVDASNQPNSLNWKWEHNNNNSPSYRHWDTVSFPDNEPNNFGNADCVDTCTDFGYCDTVCSYLRGYICRDT